MEEVSLYLVDEAKGYDELIYVWIEVWENIELYKVVDALIKNIKQLPEVKYGDIVKASHQNIIVDILKGLSLVVDVYLPCSKFSEIVKKLRYVKKGDLILPEDHNLVVDALKELLKCCKEVFGNSTIINEIESLISSLNYVEKGDPVTASDQNTKFKVLDKMTTYILLYLFYYYFVPKYYGKEAP